MVLETEVTNKGALGLYEKLDFVRFVVYACALCGSRHASHLMHTYYIHRDKRLQRYYLNGVDAFRLKLWLNPPIPLYGSGPEFE